MSVYSKNVQQGAATLVPQVKSLGVKHLTLRLPTAPDFAADADEAAGLTRMRAIKELISGERFSIHAFLMLVIEEAPERRVVLEIPKLQPIPTGTSFERLDVRVDQTQIQILDGLRDQLKPRPDILDIREYYRRVDVLRALLRAERSRLEKVFTRWILTDQKRA